MTCYIYMHDKAMEYADIKVYLEKNQLNADKVIEDTAPKKLHWTEREINQLIRKMEKGNTLVVHAPGNIACSTSQILEILNIAALREISLHFVKYNMIIKNDSNEMNTQYFISLISRIESDFVSQRTTQALARRKAAGLPLGRPKGKQNKSLKLDKFRDEITKYLSLGISKASIAKLVACHPQTLYDWLDRKENRNDQKSDSE